jgi:ABC-type multidrug transport system ATPase subunit
LFAGLADFIIIAIALYMKIIESKKKALALKAAKLSMENIAKSIEESESSKGISALLKVFSDSINNQKLRLRFDFKTLGLKQGKKVILDNVSGTIKAGRLTAIMGPSG